CRLSGAGRGGLRRVCGPRPASGDHGSTHTRFGRVREQEEESEMAFTIVLAYSGGLDTSIIVPWLRENYENAEVVCVAADVGQGEELSGLEARARQQGASALVVEDLRDAFVRETIWPTLRAGAVYARKYLLGTSM